MAEIEQAKVKTKAEADKYLQKVEPVGRSYHTYCATNTSPSLHGNSY